MGYGCCWFRRDIRKNYIAIALLIWKRDRFFIGFCTSLRSHEAREIIQLRKLDGQYKSLYAELHILIQEISIVSRFSSFIELF